MERSIRGTTSAVFNDMSNSIEFFVLSKLKGENDKPTVTSLPDIDGDEGFQLLHRQDKDIVSKYIDLCIHFSIIIQITKRI